METFRDVDVAVYTTERNLMLNWRRSCQSRLVPIDSLPAKFRHYVLTKGKIIVEKVLGLYEGLLKQTNLSS